MSQLRNAVALACLLLACAPARAQEEWGPDREDQLVWVGRQGELRLDYAADGSWGVSKQLEGDTFQPGFVYRSLEALRAANPAAAKLWEQTLAPIQAAIHALLSGSDPAAARSKLLELAQFTDLTFNSSLHERGGYGLVVHELHAVAATLVDHQQLERVRQALNALAGKERAHYWACALVYLAKNDLFKLRDPVSIHLGPRFRAHVVVPQGGEPLLFAWIDGRIAVGKPGSKPELEFPDVAALEAQRPQLFALWAQAEQSEQR